MASNITLSAGVRQNLLALQNTASMMATTQNRLATGKKVNSALDNPSNFFTSQALSNRAGDLNSLLDSIGQAQQTLKAADTGITSLTKLVESAKSLAKQAQQATPPADTYSLAITGTAIAADVPAEVNGTAITGMVGTNNLNDLNGATAGTPALTAGQSITISDGANSRTFTVGDPTLQTVDDLLNQLNGPASTSWTATLNAGAIEIVSKNNTDTITVSGSAAATLGFAGNTTGKPTNTTIGALSGSMTIGVGANTTTLNFGAGNIQNRVELTKALSNIAGINATINGSNQLSITSTGEDSVTIGGSNANSFFNVANIGKNDPTFTAGAPVASRTTLQTQFNDLLKQIDQMASDASYNGINLLSGDDLKVTFNEDGTSSMKIGGVDFDSAGLGLTSLSGTEFQSNKAIDTVIAAVDGALGALRSQASKFGSNLTTVQARQDFTKNMINTLQVGSDALVLADTNEEGANLLALQTRQQLSTTALSMASQADQAVLRLF